MNPQIIQNLMDRVGALEAQIQELQKTNPPNTLTWHTHTGVDFPKVKPTDLAAWIYIPKKPSQTAQIPNGQMQAFAPADLGMYVTGFGWCVLSFLNAFVQKTTSGTSISPTATVQVFTGTPTTDSQGEMPAGTFTAVVDGWYQVNATVKVDLDGTFQVKKNGSTYAMTTGSGSLSISRMIQLSAGDTLTFYVTNNDTLSTMTLSGTYANSELDIYKLANVIS